MSSEESKALVRRVFEEGFNQGLVEITEEVIASDFVDHSSGHGVPTEGRESFRQTLTLFRSAFPDVHATIDDLIVEGDKVVARAHWSGTHRGDLFGIPPTGKPFTITSIDILRVVDGKLVEHWGNEDNLSMMQQLGVIPAP